MADRLLVALLDADGVSGLETLVILHASAHRLLLKVDLAYHDLAKARTAQRGLRL